MHPPYAGANSPSDAGVPTVVYGFFALTTITPALQWLHDGFSVYNAMSAGIAVLKWNRSMSSVTFWMVACSLRSTSGSISRSSQESAESHSRFRKLCGPVIPASRRSAGGGSS